MDLKTIVAEVESWPVADRLELVEEIWNGLIEEGHEPELSEGLKATLEGRVAALDADPHDVLTWEEIVDHVKHPR